MKTNLTPEESQRLIELGVDPSKASKSCIVCKEPYLGASNRFCNDVKVPIFDLSDIISLLPTKIMIHSSGDTLGMIYHCGQWRAGYSHEAIYCDHTKVAPELIDAIFELLVWCITNKHIEL